MNDNIFTINKDNNNYTGIKLEKTANHSALQKILSIESSVNWIIDLETGNVSEFKFIGIHNDNGTPVLYGPFFEGSALNKILQKPVNEAYNHLIDLTKAVNLIKNKYNISVRLTFNGILFLKDNKILIFSPVILKKIQEISSSDYNCINSSLINHPYLINDNENLSYSLNCLIYRIFTGYYPYSGNTEEDINAKIRNLNLVKPDIYNPDIKNEISSYIHQNFLKNKFKNDDAQKILEYLLTWRGRGLIKNISQKRPSQIENEIVKAEFNNQKKLKNKMFIEKHVKTILIGAVLSVITAFLLIYFIRIYTKPKLTKGFEPLKVIQSYYGSYNTLDNIMMKDCLLKSSLNPDFYAIVNLSLSAKQIYAMSDKKLIITPDEWYKKNKPEIKDTDILFGIRDLSVKEENNIDNRFTYTASYEKWITLSRKNPETFEIKKTAKGVKINEKLYIRQINDYWLIYKIEKISENEID